MTRSIVSRRANKLASAENPAPLIEGITEPFLDVTLSASVAGIITAQKFREGDFVKEGDVILELDRKLEELETARRAGSLHRYIVDGPARAHGVHELPRAVIHLNDREKLQA